MGWAVAAILVLVVAIFLVRDRNLRRRLPQPEKPVPVQNSPFFAMQCEFGETEIKQGRGIVSMVMSVLGPAAEVLEDADAGTDAYGTLVRVASPEGGFTTAAIVYGREARHLRQGDIVICVPVAFREHLASRFDDRRLGWLWELRAQVDPHGDPAEGFKTLRRFDPPRAEGAR
ncbi:MAG: hypothetical protein M3Q08_09310 [Pseudomonadota bacterium]|nr:hypothetical protein [Pseudomonadota bacterium]